MIINSPKSIPNAQYNVCPARHVPILSTLRPTIFVQSFRNLIIFGLGFIPSYKKTLLIVKHPTLRRNQRPTQEILWRHNSDHPSLENWRKHLADNSSVVKNFTRITPNCHSALIIHWAVVARDYRSKNKYFPLLAEYFGSQIRVYFFKIA